MATPKRFNGKPMSHWENEAKKLVVDRLIRAAELGNSLPGQIASARLLELAKAESEELFKELCKERDTMRYNLAAVLLSMRPRKRTTRKRNA